MLRKVAVALIAATMFTAPVFAQGSGSAAPASQGAKSTIKSTETTTDKAATKPVAAKPAPMAKGATKTGKAVKAKAHRHHAKATTHVRHAKAKTHVRHAKAFAHAKTLKHAKTFESAKTFKHGKIAKHGKTHRLVKAKKHPRHLARVNHATQAAAKPMTRPIAN